MKLHDLAEAVGIPRKGYYTLTEVATATGIPYSTIREATRAGELRSFLPPHRKRGRLVSPEWLEEWMRGA